MFIFFMGFTLWETSMTIEKSPFSMGKSMQYLCEITRGYHIVPAPIFMGKMVMNEFQSQPSELAAPVPMGCVGHMQQVTTLKHDQFFEVAGLLRNMRNRQNENVIGFRCHDQQEGSS